jgi:CheY-like chemotaxis protein
MSLPASVAVHDVLSDLKVLYVDGSPDRERFTGMFERRGATVTSVATAREALEAFDSARPELIVSRVGLSGDPDCYALIRAIRNRSAETGGRTPAIAVAGWTGEPERLTAIEAGYTEHVSKPADFERLIETISRFAREIDESRRMRRQQRTVGTRSAAAARRPGAAFGNGVLDALDREVGDVIAGSLDYVELNKDATLLNVGDAPRYMYFPAGAVVSLLRIAESGKTVEVCPVGPDGFVGMSGLLGSGAAAHWSRVLVAGGAWRVGRQELVAAFDANAGLRAVLLQYVYGQLAEISLVAACTRAHTIDQQVARWLLTVSDRAGTNDLPLTHERIADRLGTRRSSVSLALEAYRRHGHVDLRRGRIQIVRRGALEEVACECYHGIRAEHGRRYAA